MSYHWAIWLSGSAYCEAVRSAILATAWLLVIFIHVCVRMSVRAQIAVTCTTMTLRQQTVDFVKDSSCFYLWPCTWYRPLSLSTPASESSSLLFCLSPRSSDDHRPSTAWRTTNARSRLPSIVNILCAGCARLVQVVQMLLLGSW